MNSIFIPLEQGLRQRGQGRVLLSGLFYLHSIRTRIKTAGNVQLKTGWIFYLHSITTRIKTRSQGHTPSPYWYSIFIPLQQGLRRRLTFHAPSVLLFYLHSITTRIKTTGNTYSPSRRSNSIFIPLQQGLRLFS